MYKCCYSTRREMTLMHSSSWSSGAEFWCGRVIWWIEDAIKISAQLDTSSWYFLHRGSNWTETWQNIAGENLYWTRWYFWILWKDRFPRSSGNLLSWENMNCFTNGQCYPESKGSFLEKFWYWTMKCFWRLWEWMMTTRCGINLGFFWSSKL